MNRLKELREDSGLTLTELSNELAKNGISITADALSKYERGKREPKIEVWKKLAKYFDVTIQFIQGETLGKIDILKVMNDVYIANAYSEHLPKNIKEAEKTRLYEAVYDYLVFMRTKLPKNKFKKKELEDFTYPVKNYWLDNFKFVFDNYWVFSIMHYGGNENGLLNALTTAIKDKYLSVSETVISMDFDQVAGLNLEVFEQNKDTLLRFGSKDEINKSVNDLINSLVAFRNSLDVLPDNTPKPTENDAYSF